MGSSSKKIMVLFSVILFSSILSACAGLSDSVDQNVLTTAWLTCEAVSGNPTNRPFTEKAVLVWNLHNEMDYHLNNKNAHTEVMGNTWLTSAPYFILGETSQNKDYSSLLTLNLDEADAFLCISVNYIDIETCYYDDEKYVIRTRAEAEVKLVSWPDKRIIAETHYSTKSPEDCSLYFYSRSDLSNHLVKVNNIDIFDWLIKYNSR